MKKLRISICKLVSVVLSLFLWVDVSAAVLARQCGAVGIVTYDPLPDPTAPDAYTRTTVVPVPYAWLLQNWPGTVDEYYSYEAAAKATSGKTDCSGNALQVWQDYVAGTDPINLMSRFTAKIEMIGGAPVVTWEPDLNTNGVIRTYKVYGKETLDGGGEWQYPTNSLHRFFKVTVEMP